ncbi:beta-lactamase family protein [Archangium minus]|uniref:Beta-lactamase family protein n=1 Tax=Archangium minus TaxID=83450 RepID=A0ABY9XBB4_9BACT|nr:beta-lactamase family protein [Archangium minus]
MGDRNTCRRLPGARFEYSSTNDILVSHIIEKVTGTPLAQQLRTRIFEPLELRSTGLDGGERRDCLQQGRSKCVGHGARTFSVPRLAEPRPERQPCSDPVPDLISRRSCRSCCTSCSCWYRRSRTWSRQHSLRGSRCSPLRRSSSTALRWSPRHPWSHPARHPPPPPYQRARSSKPSSWFPSV